MRGKHGCNEVSERRSSASSSKRFLCLVLVKVSAKNVFLQKQVFGNITNDLVAVWLRDRTFSGANQNWESHYFLFEQKRSITAHFEQIFFPQRLTGEPSETLASGPFLWGPPWGVTRVNCTYFRWKTYYSLIYCTTKQIISEYSTFKGAPYRNCNVQVLCSEKDPISNGNSKVICIQRGFQQPLKCVRTLLLNFIEGPPKETAMYKYSGFKVSLQKL